MDLKELRRLMRLMKEFDLAEVEIEEEGRKVRLRAPQWASSAVPATIPMAPVLALAPAPGSAAPTEDETSAADGLLEIPSPTVGTFYRAPSPDDPAYANVGDIVGPDSVVCILEAMKVMNEIKAEVEGEIVEILVNNGEAVEYGQPLFLVRPPVGSGA